MPKITNQNKARIEANKFAETTAKEKNSKAKALKPEIETINVLNQKGEIKRTIQVKRKN
jgi:hypothetical protein